MTSITWTQRGGSNRDTRREEPKISRLIQSLGKRSVLIEGNKFLWQTPLRVHADWLQRLWYQQHLSRQQWLRQSNHPRRFKEIRSETVDIDDDDAKGVRRTQHWEAEWEGNFDEWKKEVGNWKCEMYANSNRMFEGRISGSRLKNWNPTWLMTQHYTWNELLSNGVATCAGSSTLKLRIVVWRTSVAGFGSRRNMELSCRARLGESEWIMV